MTKLFKTPKVKPVIQRDREDEEIQNAARESRRRPTSIRTETMLTTMPMASMAQPIVRRQAMGV